MSEQQSLIIEPGVAERQYWLDLWRYRELFLVLAWRDVAVRYKQTVIGIAWALIQPVATMLIFTTVFGSIAKLPSNGQTPYALMVFAGLIPWQFFAASLVGASSSLIGNANLISKVYFPRLIIPTAAIVVSFIDFLICFIVMAALMIWYQYIPSWRIITLPFFIVMAFMASLGPGLWITALNVKYRDFRYIIPFIVQFGLYLSPVGFTTSIVPDEWRLLFSINPMVGVIDGFRWAILGKNFELYTPGLLLNWATILILLWLGIRKFRKMEKQFADLI